MPKATEAGLSGLAAQWRKKKQPSAAAGMDGNDAAETDETIVFAAEEDEDDMQAQLKDSYSADEGYIRVDKDSNEGQMAASMISQTQEVATPEATPVVTMAGGSETPAAATNARNTGSNNNTVPTPQGLARGAGSPTGGTVTATPTEGEEDSALLRAVNLRWGMIKEDAAEINNEFDWQRSLGGDQGRTEDRRFQDGGLIPGPKTSGIRISSRGGSTRAVHLCSSSILRYGRTTKPKA